ncbi:hypothetical protein PIB30_053366, partial [Stylosanthes scabra]|nr:hypothetical protein [Stylosanthes scabra]
FHQNVCETDSLDAFNLVNLDLSLVMDHRNLPSEIKDADLMAKHVASFQLAFREWPSPSSDLLLVIQQDLAP